MTETKAIGLTEERAIYQVRCIEMRRTSGISRPSRYCMYSYRSWSRHVRLPPPPPSKSTNDESGRKAICARVRGLARVKVRPGKEGRSELKCNLSLNHILSRGGEKPLFLGLVSELNHDVGPIFQK